MKPFGRLPAGRLGAFLLVLVGCGLRLAAAAEISDDEIRIGLLVDMKGGYAHITGQGSVVAARMAIEDAGGRVLGKPIRLVYADHGNDPATAAGIARQWVDEGGIDAIADVAGSPTALAVQEVIRSRDVIAFYNSVMTPALTGSLCAANGIHWMYDGYAYNQVIGREITQLGARRWFLLVVDNQFGIDIERSLAAVIKANGGTVLGSVRHARGEANLFAKLQQAAASGADVIGLVNAGTDMVTSVRQAFDLLGVSKGKTVLAAVATALNDVHAMQPQLAQGLRLTHSFYWNQDGEARAWSRRFFVRAGAMPSDLQAGVYSSLTHYFKAVAAAGTDRGPAVLAKLREIPIRDPIVRHARLRPDGRMVHDLYLLQVKKPAEIKEPWDYLAILRTIPGDAAFRPMGQGDCPLVRGGDGE